MGNQEREHDRAGNKDREMAMAHIFNISLPLALHKRVAFSNRLAQKD